MPQASEPGSAGFGLGLGPQLDSWVTRERGASGSSASGAGAEPVSHTAGLGPQLSSSAHGERPSGSAQAPAAWTGVPLGGDIAALPGQSLIGRVEEAWNQYVP